MLFRSDVNAVCTDAARAAPEGADDIRLELAPAAPRALADAERLRLVLVNVLTNARQALQGTGRERDPDAIRLHTHEAAGRRVVIHVTDRGAGIAPDDLARIFDPFFTTRRTGTGLGLAISRNIIEGLDGTLTVTSREGHGTDVRIELPSAS